MTTIQTLILESYYPVLKINLNTEDFEEINAMTNASVARSSVSQWYFNFAQDVIFPTDVQDFLQFMNIYNNIKYFDHNPQGRKVCYYRHLNDNQYHWVHAELRPDKNYSVDNRILYLIEKEAGGEPRVEKILANARNELGASSDLMTKMDEYRERFPTSIGLILVRTKDPRIKDTLSINHGGENCYQYPAPYTYAVLLDSLTPEDFSEDLMNLFSFLRGYEDYVIGTCWSDDEDLGMDYVLKTAIEKMEKFSADKGGSQE
jgi:hypothetical protein